MAVMDKINGIEAINDSLINIFEEDGNTCLITESIDFELERKLLDKFGDKRVISVPKSDASTVSFAIGLALVKIRPVYLIKHISTFFLAFSGLVDQSAKLRYMSGSKLNFPITFVFLQTKNYRDVSEEHSDNPYSFLLHGGMKVVVPSTPYDVKGLTVSAIRDNDPVAVFLPTRISADKGEVPQEHYSIPLGVGEIKRKGSDLTIVATGHLVKVALGAAGILEKEGISAEIFDPRTLLPLDTKTLGDSISKTGRLVIIDDSPYTCGFSNFVSSIAAEQYYPYLKAPIKIVARADVPVPFSQPLEEYVLPNEEKLLNAVRQIVK
jgi:acetoin:2,6-dichlorophenolindophenol oxidoreductase subunit beta